MSRQACRNAQTQIYGGGGYLQRSRSAGCPNSPYKDARKDVKPSSNSHGPNYMQLGESTSNSAGKLMKVHICDQLLR